MGQNESRRHGDSHRRAPSAMQGWLKKMRGHITFNDHLVRRGSREIEAAHAYKDNRKERDRRRRERGKGRSRTRERGELDKGSRNDRYAGESPWLHYGHRCRPPYHGFEHRLMGFFTRRREHTARGLQMSESADRERRRERQRRQRRLADEGLAIRMGASQLIHGGRRRHSSQRNRHSDREPERDMGRSRSVHRSRSRRDRDRGMPREDSRAPIARSPVYPGSPGPSYSNYDHAGHGHGGGRVVPVLRSIHSKNHAYYDDGGVPIVRSINGGGSVSVPHSPYAHSAGIARSASSYHGRHYTH